MTWTIHTGRAQDILPGEYAGRVDMIFTSPPYDGLRSFGGHTERDWDFDAVADAILPTLADGGVIVWLESDAVVDGSESGTSFRHALAFLERGLRLHQTLIYQKWSPNGTSPNRYFRSHEYMFVLSAGKPKTANVLCDRKALTPGRVHQRRSGLGRDANGHRGETLNRHVTPDYTKRGTVWFYNPLPGAGHPRHEGNTPYEHPSVNPYYLVADHIRSWTNPGDLVLDPLCGSGTTLRAAIDLGARRRGAWK